MTVKEYELVSKFDELKIKSSNEKVARYREESKAEYIRLKKDVAVVIAISCVLMSCYTLIV